MKHRWMVVGLAAVAAVAIAVPASGAGSTVLQALDLAKTANHRSSDAKRLALDAVHRARVAQADALRAVKIARRVKNGAQGPAGPQGAPGQPPKLKFASVPGSFSTSSTSYVDGGGPEVTVDVPDSGGGTGFIEVWAQATGHGNGGGEGAMGVGLYDVTGGGSGTPVAGQAQLCQPSFAALGAELFVTSDSIAGVFGTPAGFWPDGCAVPGPPAPVLLSAPAGQRTFRLMYASCGCAPDATVDSRNLWIAPRPTN